MADGKPPYHTVRPMLAMVMIPSKPPPTLTNGPLPPLHLQGCTHTPTSICICGRVAHAHEHT
jgi:hypothetical protein